MKRFDANQDLIARTSAEGDAIAIPIGRPRTRAEILLLGFETETTKTQKEVEKIVAPVEKWRQLPNEVCVQGWRVGIGKALRKGAQHLPDHAVLSIGGDSGSTDPGAVLTQTT